MASGDDPTVDGESRPGTWTGETLAEPAAGTAPPSGSPTAGTTIGRYVVRRELGAGAFGIVYEALDPELDRRVALKILRAGGGSERRRARFAREGKAIAQLNHPNVVTVHDVGTADGRLFITMELVDGQPLGGWLDEAPRSVAEIVAVFAQAGRGLAAAHARGIVHRDFKPDNVLVGRDGRVRVADFGLARISDAPEDRSDEDEPGSDDALARVTHTGTRLGTPAYMAPEQLQGGVGIDARCDQFAFGVALHEALTGVRPFAGTDVTTLTDNVLAGRRRAVAPERAPARALARVIDRCLATPPAARFASFDALLAALEQRPARRRWPWLVGGGVAIAGVAAALLLASRGAAGDNCASAGAPLATAWSPARRAEIGAAFAATGAAHAAASWTRTAARLDTWSDDWIAAQIAACEQRGAAPIAAARVACLDGQRRTLEGVLRELGAPDRELVARAAEIPLRLPSPSACMFAQASDDPARGAALRDEVADLRAADAASDGLSDELVARARADTEEARRLGERALQAEAGLIYGRMLRVRQSNDAGPALLDAALAAEAIGRDDLTVQAWSEWLFVAANDRKTEAEVAPMVTRAEEALHRAGDDPRLAMLLRTNQANVLYYNREDARALVLFREAHALAEAAYGPDHPKVGYTLDNLGNALGSLAYSAENDDDDARYSAEALAAGERAVAILGAALGPEHPAVGRALQNVGSTLEHLRRDDEAIEHYERALELQTAAFGPEHPALSATLISLGYVQINHHRLEAAIGTMRRAVTALEHGGPGDAEDLQRCVRDLADLLMASAQPTEAALLYDRGAAMAKGATIQKWRREAAVARLEAGEARTALRELQEVVAAEAEVLAQGDVMRGLALVGLARAELATGSPADAQATLDRVTRLIAGAGSDVDTAELTADVAVTHAEILAARGKAAAARAAVAHALDGCGTDGCDLDRHGLRRRADAVRGDK